MGADLNAVSGPDPEVLTAVALRGVPLRALVDKALFEETKSLRSWARDGGLSERQRRELGMLVAAAESSLGRAPGRPPLYSEAHFLDVAVEYTEAWKAGGHPRQAVADRWRVSPATAAKWVARARQMGLLPPTERGRPRGGEPPEEHAAPRPGPQARSGSRLQEIKAIEARERLQVDVLRRHEAWLAEFTGIGQSGKETSPRSARSRPSGRARKRRAGLPPA
jgi:transposase